MKPWRILGQSRAASGGELFLCERDGEYLLRIDGWELMASSKSGSEEAMADIGCRHIRNRPDANVLVSGLGMGYSLRATLDTLHPQARVTVAEFVPEIVEWHRGPLGPLAGNPVDDPRVTVHVGDVKEVLERGPDTFDAILLDLDNGPTCFIDTGPDALYGPTGLRTIHRALRGETGVLVIWSAGPDIRFEKRMRQCGFQVESVVSSARKGGKGAKHVLFVGRKAGRPSRRRDGK